MLPDISRRQSHLARLVVFLASIAEGALILYVVIGPARFEPAVLRGVARLGRVAPRADTVLALSAERVGNPSEAAWQWTKAAHHAHGGPEVTETASGLTRVGAAHMPALRTTLCLLAGDGTPTAN